MFLFSPFLLRELKFAIELTDFFKVLPIQWNSTSGLMEYTESPKKFSFRSWNFIKYFMLINEAILALRYFQISFEVTIDKFGLFVVETLGFLAFTLGTFFQVFFIILGRALITCCNGFLNYYTKVQGMNTFFRKKIGRENHERY